MVERSRVDLMSMADEVTPLLIKLKEQLAFESFKHEMIIVGLRRALKFLPPRKPSLSG
jgi:hypothetical protein